VDSQAYDLANKTLAEAIDSLMTMGSPFLPIVLVEKDGQRQLQRIASDRVEEAAAAAREMAASQTDADASAFAIDGFIPFNDRRYDAIVVEAWNFRTNEGIRIGLRYELTGVMRKKKPSLIGSPLQLGREGWYDPEQGEPVAEVPEPQRAVEDDVAVYDAPIYEAPVYSAPGVDVPAAPTVDAPAPVDSFGPPPEPSTIAPADIAPPPPLSSLAAPSVASSEPSPAPDAVPAAPSAPPSYEEPPALPKAFAPPVVSSVPVAAPAASVIPPAPETPLAPVTPPVPVSPSVPDFGPPPTTPPVAVDPPSSYPPVASPSAPVSAAPVPPAPGSLTPPVARAEAPASVPTPALPPVVEVAPTPAPETVRPPAVPSAPVAAPVPAYTPVPIQRNETPLGNRAMFAGIMELATKGRSFPAFAIVQKGGEWEQVTMTDLSLKDAATSVRAYARSRTDAEFIAFAIDGFVDVNGTNVEAVIVEVWEYATRVSFSVAQRYIPTGTPPSPRLSGRPLMRTKSGWVDVPSSMMLGGQVQFGYRDPDEA